MEKSIQNDCEKVQLFLKISKRNTGVTVSLPLLLYLLTALAFIESAFTEPVSVRYPLI